MTFLGGIATGITALSAFLAWETARYDEQNKIQRDYIDKTRDLAAEIQVNCNNKADFSKCGGPEWTEFVTKQTGSPINENPELTTSMNLFNNYVQGLIDERRDHKTNYCPMPQAYEWLRSCLNGSEEDLDAIPGYNLIRSAMGYDRRRYCPPHDTSYYRTQTGSEKCSRYEWEAK